MRRAHNVITVYKLSQLWKDNKFSYDLIGQRELVWEKDRKERFIDTLIRSDDYYCGAILVHHTDDVMAIVEGQNRVDVAGSYVNNEWKLSNNFKMVQYSEDEEIYPDMSGKYFSELPEYIQQRIYQYNINLEEIYDATPEQLNQQMLKSNSGKPLTAVEKARMMSYPDILKFIINVENGEFFSRKVYENKTMLSRQSHSKNIFQLLIYETGLMDGYSSKTIEFFVIKLQELGLKNEVKNRITETINYLNDAFPGRKTPILNMGNILPLYIVAQKAIEDNIDAREFYNEIINDSTIKEYKKMKGIWNTQTLINKKIEFLIDIYDKKYGKSEVQAK